MKKFIIACVLMIPTTGYAQQAPENGETHVVEQQIIVEQPVVVYPSPVWHRHLLFGGSETIYFSNGYRVKATTRPRWDGPHTTIKIRPVRRAIVPVPVVVPQVIYW